MGGWAPGLAIPLAFALLAAPGVAAPGIDAPGIRPPPSATPQQGHGPAVDAANALLALPWGGVSRQYAADGRQAIVDGLDGKALARGGGSVAQLGARWGFALTARDVSAAIDLAAPPGYRAASLTGPAVDGEPGFALDAPLGGTAPSRARSRWRSRSSTPAAG